METANIKNSNPNLLSRINTTSASRNAGGSNPDIKKELLSKIDKISNCAITIQIPAKEVVSILEAVYRKGQEDSERKLLAKIAEKEAEEYITKEEAMALLGKSDNTLWKWNKKGYLTWIKRGGTIMYSRVDVQRILTGKTDDGKEDNN